MVGAPAGDMVGGAQAGQGQLLLGHRFLQPPCAAVAQGVQQGAAEWCEARMTVDLLDRRGHMCPPQRELEVCHGLLRPGGPPVGVPEAGDPREGVDALEQPFERPGIVPPGGVPQLSTFVGVVGQERRQMQQPAQFGVLELVYEGDGQLYGVVRLRGLDAAEGVPRCHAAWPKPFPGRRRAQGKNSPLHGLGRPGLLPQQHLPGPLQHVPPLRRGRLGQRARLGRPRVGPVRVHVVQSHLQLQLVRADREPAHRMPSRSRRVGRDRYDDRGSGRFDHGASGLGPYRGRCPGLGHGQHRTAERRQRHPAVPRRHLDGEVELRA